MNILIKKIEIQRPNIFHFKAFGMINLHYEIRICQKIYNRVTMTVYVKCVVRFNVHKTLYRGTLLFPTASPLQKAIAIYIIRTTTSISVIQIQQTISQLTSLMRLHLLYFEYLHIQLLTCPSNFQRKKHFIQSKQDEILGLIRYS